MNNYKDNHDLNLPDWGPYSKKFFGISHVADISRGFRFDLAIMPSLYRRSIKMPDALRDSEYTPREVSTDLNYYAYRQQIEWKDKLYCDISFSRIDDNTHLIRCEYVNNTDAKNSFSLNLMAGIYFPFNDGVTPVLPKNAIWIDAVNYSSLEFAKPGCHDNLSDDGLRRGEVLKSETTGMSTCIGKNFGLTQGDFVTYKIPHQTSEHILFLRYRLSLNKILILQFSGYIETTVTLKGTGLFDTIKVKGTYTNDSHMVITSAGGAELQLDSLVLCPNKETDKIDFLPTAWDNFPHTKKGPVEQSLIIKFNDIEHAYGLWWSESDSVFRDCHVNNLQQALNYDMGLYHNFYNKTDATAKDKALNVLMHPITLQANSTKTVYAVITNGSFEQINTKLNKLDLSSKSLEGIYNKNRQTKIELMPNQTGDKYHLSQQLMRAVTMSNIVFPIYTMRQYIRHHTPGRCFNSLYTWDSGFIGLGLLELDHKLAMDNLNAYVTEPGNEENAFIHHGSPVPVQHYLYKELWNRTQNREMLAFFYPRLKQYYNFLAGHIASSTTRSMKSNLLKTWDYFYNSGGWDDYPPQWHVHTNKLHNITPVTTTAHVIRIAKIMMQAAKELTLHEDIQFYQNDIDVFTNALQEYAWDDASGYFSYVEHDKKGNPKQFLTDKTGTNYNMGMDGMTPLISGVCDKEQANLFYHYLSSERFITEYGLSAVDTTAPYYQRDGYWNGSVWMPYQWFFWKTCLNDGKADLAWKIAETALNIWQNEVTKSYCCFEHFCIESGRGGGWHQFSGLSTPILIWFAAYFTPGTVTTGYDVWISNQSINLDDGEFCADLQIEAGNTSTETTILIVMPSGKYSATYNSQPVLCKQGKSGTLEITLPKNSKGTLKTLPNKR